MAVGGDERVIVAIACCSDAGCCAGVGDGRRNCAIADSCFHSGVTDTVDRFIVVVVLLIDLASRWGVVG